MRFGIAVTDITPEIPLPMYGYYARMDRWDGIHDRLLFTALVLEEDGRRALIGTADLGTMPADGTRDLMDRLAAIAGCPVGNVMLNVSHTHGGPLVTAGDCWQPPGMERIPEYEQWLFERIEQAAREAVAALAPGMLRLSRGTTSLPLNRRLASDGVVTFAPDPDGPVDDRLFVFTLHDEAGALRALGLRVSCHPTGTGGKHQLNGDYVSAWKRQVREAFGSEVVPFFLQGAGADTKPRPSARDGHWTNMAFDELPPVARQLNRELAAALVNGSARTLAHLVLEGRLVPVTIPCEPRYTTPEDVARLRDGNYEERLAAAFLQQRLEAGETIPVQQEFLIQTLWLTRDLALIGIDAEVLCGTGAIVEAAVAPAQGIALGYTNGVKGYVPDRHEMARGGYEVNSFLYRGLSGPLDPGLAEQFAAAVWKRPEA